MERLHVVLIGDDMDTFIHVHPNAPHTSAAAGAGAAAAQHDGGGGDGGGGGGGGGRSLGRDRDGDDVGDADAGDSNGDASTTFVVDLQVPPPAQQYSIAVSFVARIAGFKRCSGEGAATDRDSEDSASSSGTTSDTAVGTISLAVPPTRTGAGT